MTCVVCQKPLSGLRRVCPTPCRSKWRDMRIEAHSAASAAWQYRQREAGKCATCGQPHHGTTWKCDPCRTKDNARLAARRKRWRADGRCINCGAGMLGVSRFTRCLECRDKIAQRYAAKRRKAA